MDTLKSVNLKAAKSELGKKEKNYLSSFFQGLEENIFYLHLNILKLKQGKQGDSNLARIKALQNSVKQAINLLA